VFINWWILRVFPITTNPKGGDTNGIPSQEAERSTLVQTQAARACYQAAQNWVPNVMRCKNPYIPTGKGKAYPCGQCLPCRINRRRIWAHRIMLEAGLYGDNAFITLTYDDEHDPTSLEPKHAQTFLKRLRHNYPKPIRYYLVGEYGESTDRPHYHAALFNFPACQNGNSRYSRTSGLRCCQPCHTLRAHALHRLQFPGAATFSRTRGVCFQVVCHLSSSFFL